MTRQIGFALGVSVLVAVLGSAHATDAVSAFRGGWLFMVIAGLSGAVLAVAMGPVRQHASAAAAAPAQAQAQAQAQGPAQVTLGQSPAS